MKHKLSYISPAGLAAILATFGFVGSFIGITFILFSMRPGATANLSGFVSFQFTHRIDIFILIIYPFANAFGGLISGFLIAWVYNHWARISGGLVVGLYDSKR